MFPIPIQLNPKMVFFCGDEEKAILLAKKGVLIHTIFIRLKWC